MDSNNTGTVTVRTADLRLERWLAFIAGVVVGSGITWWVMS